MTKVSDLITVQKDHKSVVTLGTFDGLHIGHKQILAKVIEKSKKFNARSVVVTFEPHPRLVLRPDEPVQLLTTLEEKIQQIEHSGIDEVVVIPFTKEFSQLTSTEFFEQVIIGKIGICGMVIGFDHRFGKGRGGDESTLAEFSQKHGFEFEKVEAVTKDGQKVSSTYIRNLIASSNFDEAKICLGYRYGFSGIVVEGFKRGRTLGFPTANIGQTVKFKQMPAPGVYAVKMEVLGKVYGGMMNFGTRPTFENTNTVFCEVHLFDFNEDIYGSAVRVYPVRRIRDEKKFRSVDELINQIKIDSTESRKILNSNN